MKAASVVIYIMMGGLVGCGQSEFSLSQSQGPKPSARVAQDPDRGVETNPSSNAQSNADAIPAQQPKKVSPPIPVIGSYLVGELLNEARVPVKDAEVTVQEVGVEPTTVKTDANGRYRMGIVSLSNVTRISVANGNSQASFATDANVVALMEQALEGKSGEVEKLFQLQLASSRTGSSRLSYQLVVPPELDNMNPRMSLKVLEGAGGIQVTVTAVDDESGLAPEAYSFDGGASWTNSSVQTLPAGTNIRPGFIVVRDRANNRASNNITIVAQ